MLKDLASFRRVVVPFSCDIKASTAIEFALLGILVIELILETMQVGLFGYESTALDRATYKVSRSIKLGDAATNSTSRSVLLNQLCAYLPAGMPCSNVIISVQNASQGLSPGGFYSFVKSDLSGLIQPVMDNSKTPYCLGGPGSFEYIRVFYAMPVFSLAWKAAGSTAWQGSTVHFLTSQSVFRNEPYASSSGSC